MSNKKQEKIEKAFIKYLKAREKLLQAERELKQMGKEGD